jgi:hypothetical protein
MVICRKYKPRYITALGREKTRWEDIIKQDLREICCEDGVV